MDASIADITERINPIIKSYKEKSKKSKKRYNRIRVIVLIQSLLIVSIICPLFDHISEPLVYLLVVSTIVGLININVLVNVYIRKHLEGHIKYQNISEKLQNEKYLYMTMTGNYSVAHVIHKFIREEEHKRFYATIDDLISKFEKGNLRKK